MEGSCKNGSAHVMCLNEFANCYDVYVSGVDFLSPDARVY